MKCGHCGCTLEIGPKPSFAPSGGQAPAEHERLAYLATAARSYDTQNPYATVEPPDDLEHINLENSDPTLPDLAEGAFRAAVDRCRASDGDRHDQRRLYWLVQKIVNMWNWRNEGPRARGVVETASEVFSDPGYRDSMNCLMADVARKAGDLDAAEQWLSRCNPRSMILDLDTEFRNAKRSIAMARGQWEEALVLVGRKHQEMPPTCPNSVPLVTLDRVACLESLGDHDAAELEMTRVLKVELHPMLPVLDHDFLTNWLADSERLAAAAAVWSRLKEKRGTAEAKLTKATAEEHFEERARRGQAEMDLRLAAAREETPSWLARGFTASYSTLAAAKQLAPAISSLLGGRAGLSGREDYNAAGTWNGRAALVTFYLTGGIAKVTLRTTGARQIDLSFDLRYDKKGRRKYHPEPQPDLGWDGARGRAPRHRAYLTENAYLKHETSWSDRPNDARRRSEHVERLTACAPDDLLERTNRFLRRSFMDLHFRGQTMYGNYVNLVFWKADPVGAIAELLNLADDWTELIEWTEL